MPLPSAGESRMTRSTTKEPASSSTIRTPMPATEPLSWFWKILVLLGRHEAGVVGVAQAFDHALDGAVEELLVGERLAIDVVVADLGQGLEVDVEVLQRRLLLDGLRRSQVIDHHAGGEGDQGDGHDATGSWACATGGTARRRGRGRRAASRAGPAASSMAGEASPGGPAEVVACPRTVVAGTAEALAMESAGTPAARTAGEAAASRALRSSKSIRIRSRPRAA